MQTLDEKIKTAIRYLGEQWVFHPKNYVKKLKRPFQSFFEPQVLKQKINPRT